MSVQQKRHDVGLGNKECLVQNWPQQKLYTPLGAKVPRITSAVWDHFAREGGAKKRDTTAIMRKRAIHPCTHAPMHPCAHAPMQDHDVPAVYPDSGKLFCRQYIQKLCKHAPLKFLPLILCLPTQ